MNDIVSGALLFTNERSAMGYRINKLAMALTQPTERDRMKADEEGFMAEHGHWGMRVDGVTVLEPKPYGCTVAMLDDGTLKIRTFSELGPDAARVKWYRQTPPCMLEQGKMHPKLDNPDAKAWGATLSGATIIRRSAIGLDASGRTMFIALGNSTNARALALAMAHVRSEEHTSELQSH